MNFTMNDKVALPGPVELNKNLLNSVFKFQPLSKLKKFVINKTGVEKTHYTLAEILTMLKDVIRREGMFDSANPSVILCSRDLEEALNMRALHVTEVRDLVLSHIIKVSDQSLREEHNQKVSDEAPRGPIPAPTSLRVIKTVNISTVIFTNKNAKFTLKPKFLRVIQSVPDIDMEQTVYTYGEVCLLLSKYMLSKSDEIFDQRNVRLALVSGTLLGEAFGVTAFHRCQVNNLLRGQLIPVKDNLYPEMTILTSTASSDVSSLSHCNPKYTGKDHLEDSCLKESTNNHHVVKSDINSEEQNLKIEIKMEYPEEPDIEESNHCSVLMNETLPLPRHQLPTLSLEKIEAKSSTNSTTSKNSNIEDQDLKTEIKMEYTEEPDIEISNYYETLTNGTSSTPICQLPTITLEKIEDQDEMTKDADEDQLLATEPEVSIKIEIPERKELSEKRTKILLQPRENSPPSPLKTTPVDTTQGSDYTEYLANNKPTINVLTQVEITGKVLTHQDILRSILKHSVRKAKLLNVSNKELQTMLRLAQSENESMYNKGLVTKTTSGIRKRFNGKQWRSLCTYENCLKESQKKRRCMKHMNH